MELSEALRTVFVETAKVLKGHDRRVFMARVVRAFGKGGQRQAEVELHWNRRTIRKGEHELTSGLRCYDYYAGRGRKRAEEHHPTLLADVKDIVDGQSQTDPTFKTTRLYTRLSAAEVRHQLVQQKEYADQELCTTETIRTKLNDLDYHPTRVRKSQPLKKIPETDAIFDQLGSVNQAADADDMVLRLSLDAKATVLVGQLSRGGYSRVVVKAWDHDFRPKETVTPFGIFLPRYDELHLYLTTSSCTSDFIVDCLRDFWLTNRARFASVQTLVLNQDNGPEHHSRRTQFMNRITDLVDEFRLTVQLAYYPPYHSKYNPVERVWGVLEQHWNGSLLDTVDTVRQFAQTMTWHGQRPVVHLVQKTYHTGVRLTQKAMAALEKRFARLPQLEKWFVRIAPLPP
jgi:hypothetical protein